eukprot:UN00767
MASTDLCPTVYRCTADKQVRCGDGTCRASSAECPKYSTCPEEFGYEICDQLKPEYKNVNILDGMCAPRGQCLASNGCPVLENGQGAYHRCENGQCVLNPTQCSNQNGGNNNAQVINGCPIDKPQKCWNGECVEFIQGVNTCPPTNGCPIDKPFRCASGVCLTDSTACIAAGEDIEGGCIGENKFTCANGDCVNSFTECKTSFGCPVDKPVRCANGDCRRFPAHYRNPFYQLNPQQIIEETCPPTPTCPIGFKMCNDKKCVVDLAHCTTDLSSIVGATGSESSVICPTGEVLCYDKQTCRPSLDKCFSKPIYVSGTNGANVTIWYPTIKNLINTSITTNNAQPIKYLYYVKVVVHVLIRLYY